MQKAAEKHSFIRIRSIPVVLVLLLPAACSTTVDNTTTTQRLRFEPDAALVSAVPECSLDADNPSVVVYCLYNYALRQQQAGNTEHAIQLLKQVLEFDPERADVQELLGDIYLEEGDLHLAQSAYRSAVETGIESSKAFNNLGVISDRSGDLESAIAHFQQAIQLGPEIARTHYNLGSAYARHGEQFNLAVEKFLHAVRLDPAFAEAFYDLGQVYERLGERQLAVGAYNSAAAIGHEAAQNKLRELAR